MDTRMYVCTLYILMCAQSYLAQVQGRTLELSTRSVPLN